MSSFWCLIIPYYSPKKCLLGYGVKNMVVFAGRNPNLFRAKSRGFCGLNSARRFRPIVPLRGTAGDGPQNKG